MKIYFDPGFETYVFEMKENHFVGDDDPYYRFFFGCESVKELEFVCEIHDDIEFKEDKGVH